MWDFMQTNEMLTDHSINTTQSGMRKAYTIFLFILVLIPVFRATVFIRRRSPLAYSQVDMYNSVQIIITFVMVILLSCRRAIDSNRLMMKGPTFLLLLYTVFCVMSAIWSSGPIYTAYRAIEVLVTFLFMGHLLYFINNRRKAMIWLCRIAAMSAFFGYLKLLLQGQIFQHTNSYSTAGAFGAILALACIRNGIFKLSDIKYTLLICLGTVVFGTSSASNVSLLVGIILIISSTKKQAISGVRLLLVAILTYFILTTSFYVIMPYVFPGKTIDNIKTGRGRTGLFSMYEKTIYEHPIIGSGFAVGEREALGPGVNWTHNSLLSVTVNTGMVGLLLFIGGFISILYSLYRAQKIGNEFASPLMIAILVGFLNSMSYPLIGSIWTASTTSFWGLLAYVSIYFHQERENVSFVPEPFCNYFQSIRRFS